MRRVFVGGAGQREGSTALRIGFNRIYGFENHRTQQVVRVLACVGDDFGRLKPITNVQWDVALDYREQIAEERKPGQLSAVSMRVVQAPTWFGCVAVSWIKKRLDERMVQSNAAIEECDEPRISSIWCLN